MGGGDPALELDEPARVGVEVFLGVGFFLVDGVALSREVEACADVAVAVGADGVADACFDGPASGKSSVSSSSSSVSSLRMWLCSSPLSKYVVWECISSQQCFSDCCSVCCAMLQFLPFITDALSSLFPALAEGDGDASSDTGKRSLIFML